MKVSRIHIENFKRFTKIDINVQSQHSIDIPRQFLILGDNGSGKTTILQAIALCLSMVTGKIKSISQFNWQGWVPGRYGKWGKPIIEIDVNFTEEEIIATKEIAQHWIDLRSPITPILPPENKKLTLRVIGEHCEVLGENGRIDNANKYQLMGRFYASQLLQTSTAFRNYFLKLPGFFWFDQFRNLGTPSFEEQQQSSGRVAYNIGVARLRKYLTSWKLNQLANPHNESDWLRQLENSYTKVFPNRCFGEVEPMFDDGTPTAENYYFTLSDGSKSYDIEEMSAGEQSIFPMLFEFVRQQICNSIVLIDEVDLNLHPPLAQSLVNALPSIGNNCQFIITTHSKSVTTLMSREDIYCIPGGRSCL